MSPRFLFVTARDERLLLNLLIKEGVRALHMGQRGEKKQTAIVYVERKMHFSWHYF